MRLLLFAALLVSRFALAHSPAQRHLHELHAAGARIHVESWAQQPGRLFYHHCATINVVASDGGVLPGPEPTPAAGCSCDSGAGAAAFIALALVRRRRSAVTRW